MKKMRIALATLAVLASTAVMAKDPCGSELCLSDYRMALAGGMCKQQMDDFFSIIKYKKHGRFDPSGTLKARRDYLNQCDSGNSAAKATILANFGSIIKP